MDNKKKFRRDDIIALIAIGGFLASFFIGDAEIREKAFVIIAVIMTTIKLFNPPSASSIVLSVCLIIALFCWTTHRNKIEFYNAYQAHYTGEKRESHGRSNYYSLWYEYADNDSIIQRGVSVSSSIWDSEPDSMKHILITDNLTDNKYGLDAIDFEKYKYPVKYCNGGRSEIGNDSYEFAKYEPNREYENFGFNVVYLATTHKKGEIIWKDVSNKSLKMNYSENRDTFLVYSNINPNFFDGWHVCPDSISTPENLAKIEKDGYGYIFRGKIHSKEETEKYWNIIEQYKLREAGK